MNLAVWLENAALAHPERPALFEGKSCVATYAQFWERARSFAAWLAARGIERGDRVAIFMGNCPDYLVALYGIWAMGGAAVPINATLHGREAVYILENSGARLALCDAPRAAALSAAEAPCDVVTDLHETCEHAAVAGAAECAPGDLAWLFYTSGTTGRPKGVMITHGMIEAMTTSYFASVDDVYATDAALYAAPMSHGAGLYNVMHVLKGARHVCPASGGFDPAETFDLAAHFGAVHMFAAPTMVKRMTDAAKVSGQRGRGIRTIVYGGGPMYVADLAAARATFGDVFVQIYGQGECPMAITALSRADITDDAHPDWALRAASVGRAQADTEVAITDAAGQRLPAGEIGEIMVRSAAVMPGYWQNAEATAATLRDAWLLTGDMGWLDAAGYLTLQDRSKDVIITGGSNVYPREVEEVLLQHPLIEEVSVVGRPHPDWGEEVVACCVGTASPGDLDALCRAHIARFKAPKAYVFVQELPKNNYGKVLKTKLREVVLS